MEGHFFFPFDKKGCWALITNSPVRHRRLLVFVTNTIVKCPPIVKVKPEKPIYLEVDSVLPYSATASLNGVNFLTNESNETTYPLVIPSKVDVTKEILNILGYGIRINRRLSY